MQSDHSFCLSHQPFIESTKATEWGYDYTINLMRIIWISRQNWKSLDVAQLQNLLIFTATSLNMLLLEVNRNSLRSIEILPYLELSSWSEPGYSKLIVISKQDVTYSHALNAKLPFLPKILRGTFFFFFCEKILQTLCELEGIASPRLMTFWLKQLGPDHCWSLHIWDLRLTLMLVSFYFPHYGLSRAAMM